MRILASDGVNTGEGDAGPFVVAGNFPTALIEFPSDQASFVIGENVLLSGDGVDLEDGSLPETALSWTSSLDGALGTGSWLERSDLRLGTHLITLTVRDSAGNQSSASVTIYIRQPHAIYLPLMQRRLPPTPTPTPTRTPTPRPTATPTPRPTATPTVPPSGGINGRVTYYGAAAPHLRLELSHYDGSDWSTVATTNTG